MASNKFEITLQGEASILLPAERAVLSIEVSNTGHDKQSVSKEVVSTAKQVETLLRKLAPQSASAGAKAHAAVDNWSRTSLSESSQVPYDHQNQKERPREYTAEVDFEVHFQRFQAIGGLIHDLAAVPCAQTKPLKWILLEQTKESHQSALRSEAAKNAYHKALGYAKALGYEKVQPFSLRETQLYASTSNRKMGIPSDGTTTSKKNMAEADTDEWEEVGGSVYEYQPEDIKVRVMVNTEFYAL